MRSKELIEVYRRALARHLAHASALNQYDEIEARDQALARLEKSRHLSEVMATMDEEGYPKVTLSQLPPLVAPAPPPVPDKGGVRGFMAKCRSALFGNTSAETK